MTKDMTRGRPLNVILRFFAPLMLGNLFQQLYSMADTLIVGRFVGVSALAGVGSTGSLSFLVLGFVTGVCSGYSIPVAQYFGAGNYPQMRRCVGNAALQGGIIAAVLTAATVACTRQVLTLMDTPADIFGEACCYILIVFGGIPATMLYNLLSGILRALGDSRTPLFFLIAAAALNVALDLILILCFGMGVAGAAWATIIAQGVSGLLCLVFIWRKVPILHLGRQDLRWDGAEQRQLALMGIPMALQFSITAIGTIAVQAAVNALGSGVVAAVTAGSKIHNLLMTPLETMGITMATYCGQNLGAERIDRVRAGVRAGIGVCFLYCLLACLVSCLFGAALSRLFLTGENIGTMVDQAARFLVVTGFCCPALGLLLVVRNSIQGLGFSLPAMMAGVFELAARSWVAFCLVRSLGYLAVCLASPAAWLAADAFLLVIWFREIRGLLRRYPPDPSVPLY